MSRGYDEMLAWVQQAWPHWRVTRQRNLAWAVLGLLRVREAHLTVAEMSRALRTRSKAWHKSMWRFLTNLGWFGVQGFGPLVAFVRRRYRPGSYVLVAFDQSTLGGSGKDCGPACPFADGLCQSSSPSSATPTSPTMRRGVSMP